MEHSITLLELNRQISEVINMTFDSFIWVTAEISEIRTAANGHCYLELVEKSKKTNSIVARQRATIWNQRYWLLKETFENSTGQVLKAGIKILVCVQVQMHEAYGMSLNIVDIDPSFTLGEMALRKQEILKRLTEEGMIDMNKEIAMPVTPQRIAVISAKNAAGYGDFCHQLENNEFGAKFYVHLFPAVMQGEKTEASVISALDSIYKNIELFDVVVIIRGGGGVADLSAFDSYDLAVNIANFPIPVIVGIGHERDNSVLDVVAHTSVKTPTAAAALLIDCLGEQIAHLDQLKNTLVEAVNWRMENNKMLLDRYLSAIKTSQITLRGQLNQLAIISEKIKLHSALVIERQKQRHTLLEKTIELTRPENILSRGFSITRVDGHAIKDSSTIKEGTLIETQTAKGRFTSKFEHQVGCSK